MAAPKTVKLGTIGIGGTPPKFIDIRIPLRTLDLLPEFLAGSGTAVETEFYKNIMHWAQDIAYKHQHDIEGSLVRDALNLLYQNTMDTRAQNFIRYAQIIQQANALNEKALRRSTVPGGRAMSFFFTTNSAVLAAQISKFLGPREMIDRAYYAAVREFRPYAKQYLILVLTRLAEQQDQRAFPRAYIAPMVAAANRINIEIIGRGTTVRVFIPNLHDALGDRQDLERAYHEGALLNTAPKNLHKSNASKFRANILNGPVAEAQLRNDETRRGTRYNYWRALSSGATQVQYAYGTDVRFTTRAGKEVKFRGTRRLQTYPIPANAWGDTIRTRLAVWGAKAPQWLLLEYGQFRWKPTIQSPESGRTNVEGEIHPAGITGNWYDAMSLKWEQLIKTAWDNQINNFSNAPTPPEGYGYSRSGKLVKLSSEKGFVLVGEPQYGGNVFTGPYNQNLGPIVEHSEDDFIPWHSKAGGPLENLVYRDFDKMGKTWDDLFNVLGRQE